MYQNVYTYMEKLTKQHMKNCKSEKLAHKICAKIAQNRAELAKVSKIAPKSSKTLIKGE